MGDVLDEWSGDDIDELIELLETQLSELGLDLKFEVKDEEEEEEDDEEEDEESDDFDDEPLLDDED